MKMIKWIGIVSLFIAGCGNGNQEATSPTPTPVVDRLQVMQSVYNRDADGGESHIVLRDTQSGNEYLVVRNSKGLASVRLTASSSQDYKNRDRFQVLQSIYNREADGGEAHVVLRDTFTGDEYLSIRSGEDTTVIKLSATGH